jgi:hypothetical protein
LRLVVEQVGTEEADARRKMVFRLEGDEDICWSSIEAQASIEGLGAGVTSEVRLDGDGLRVEVVVERQLQGDYDLDLELRGPVRKPVGIRGVWRGRLRELRGLRHAAGQSIQVSGNNNIVNLRNSSGASAPQIDAIEMKLVDIEALAEEVPTALCELVAQSRRIALIAVGRRLVIGRTGGEAKCSKDEVFVSHDMLGRKLAEPRRLSSRAVVCTCDPSMDRMTLGVEQSQTAGAAVGPEVDGERVAFGWSDGFDLDQRRRRRVSVGFDGPDPDGRDFAGKLDLEIDAIPWDSDSRSICGLEIRSCHVGDVATPLYWIATHGRFTFGSGHRDALVVDERGRLEYCHDGTVRARLSLDGDARPEQLDPSLHTDLRRIPLRGRR